MRNSPTPAVRSSLGKPEGTQDRSRSPSRPSLPPRMSSTGGPSPQPSPKPPPRPPSLKSPAPPPRPPPPNKKNEGEIMIDFPGGNPALSRSRPSSEQKSSSADVTMRSRSPLGQCSRDSANRGSFRDPTTYDDTLNPFAEDENDDEEGDEAPNTPPPPQPERSTLNPFFKASVKKKFAPSPPKSNLSPEMVGAQVQGHLGKTDDENETVTLDDPSVTSGETNENTADAEVPPVVIVSVCL